MIYLFSQPDNGNPPAEEDAPRPRAKWPFYLAGAAGLIIVLFLFVYLLTGPDATPEESEVKPDQAASEAAVTRSLDIYLPQPSRHLEIGGMVIAVNSGGERLFLVCDLNLEFQDNLTESDAHLHQLLRSAIVQTLMKKKPTDLIGPGKLPEVKRELLETLGPLMGDGKSLERILLTNFFLI